MLTVNPNPKHLQIRTSAFIHDPLNPTNTNLYSRPVVHYGNIIILYVYGINAYSKL